MKRIIVSILAFVCVLSLSAQSARQEILQNKCLSGSNLLAYPGPLQAKLTPAPKGYTPFYISHYGRHGSRYLIGSKAYDYAVQVLGRADSLGKLTPKGKEVLRDAILLRQEAHNRDGELTQLGGEQHQAIAKRMYERFPQVFAGKTPVDAKSTVVIRCIFSMENAVQQLIRMNPQIQLKQDASQHDMYYMNADIPNFWEKVYPKEVDQKYEAFAKKHRDCSHLMGVLFNDTAYVHHEVSVEKLRYRLFELANSIQGTELRHRINLYDIFTDDEIYNGWLLNNARWYIQYGPYPGNGGLAPYSQSNLLRKIIEESDSCMQYPHPGATLRYAHEVDVMPLACLLELDDCGKQEADLEKVADFWKNYRIFPMACNIQFIFYRKSAQDKDVLFKVLLNENEARLPLKTDKAPYYHWKDFKEYYLKKINRFASHYVYVR